MNLGACQAATAARSSTRSPEMTMSEAPTKTPWHLWLVGVIAVLFNAIGVFDYVMSLAQGAAYQASVGMTPEQIAPSAIIAALLILFAAYARFLAGRGVLR
jgi:hypothetical protein